MQKRRMSSIIITFIPCYLFWLLLTMSVAPKELLLGVLACGITAWFSSGVFVQGGQHRGRSLLPQPHGERLPELPRRRRLSVRRRAGR